MTEQEWMVSKDPDRMLAYLLRQDPIAVGRWWNVEDYYISMRSLALFNSACYWDLGRSPKDSSTVSAGAIINCARGLVSLGTKAEVRANLLREIRGNPWHSFKFYEPAICNSCEGNGWRYEGSLADEDEYACATCGRPAGVYGHSWKDGVRQCPKEKCHKCGGTGKKPTPCPWLTEQVISLAKAAHEEKYLKDIVVCGRCRVPAASNTSKYCSQGWDPDGKNSHTWIPIKVEDGTLDPVRLAILADALEEAGCPNSDMIEHLRGFNLIPATDGKDIKALIRMPLKVSHYKGCWVLDALLGLE